MKGIVLHWDGGNYERDRLSDEHYHFAYDGEGVEHVGNHTPEDNLNVSDGIYAAHTRHANTGRIGMTALGMHAARQNGSPGSFPLTDKSVQALIRGAAREAKKYGISVTRKTILTHAEVESELGIKQRGKIDIMWLRQFGWTEARRVGDYLRAEIRKEMATVGVVEIDQDIVDEPLQAFTGPDTEIFREFAPEAMDRLMDELDIGLLDAAGVLGNFGGETGGLHHVEELNPANPPGGLNLAQWTGVRREQFEKWARERKYDPLVWDTGLAFAIHELKNTWEKRVLPAMAAEKTLWSKTRVFSDLYERPGKPRIARRVRWALTALEAYEDRVQDTPAQTPPKVPAKKTAGAGGAAGLGGAVVVSGIESMNMWLIGGGAFLAAVGVGAFIWFGRSS